MNYHKELFIKLLRFTLKTKLCYFTKLTLTILDYSKVLEQTVRLIFIDAYCSAVVGQNASQDYTHLGSFGCAEIGRLYLTDCCLAQGAKVSIASGGI
jgi:hypothetical protein